MAFFTDNPERDFDAYEAENERWLNKRPVCCNCDEHIQTDRCFQVGDWLFCEDCEEAAMINAWEQIKEEQYRVDTEDFIYDI